jgi:SpoVK/Ycf46/Vps4 family AAA+-type ATPase
MNDTRSWEEANQIYLMAALSGVRATLERLLSPSEAPSTAETPTVQTLLEEVRASMDTPPALETLCATFGLTSFERKILLMCVGVELDSRFASLYAAANKEIRSSLPTFSLALASCEDAHWGALLPAKPLRFWRLIEVMSGDTLTTSPLRIDERIVHYLAGVPSLDERLRGLTEPLRANDALPRSQRAVAELVAASWSRASRQSPWPVVQFSGTDLAGKRAVAAAACALLGLHLRVISAQAAPRGVADVDLFIRIWEREAALQPSGLLLEYDDGDTTDAHGDASLKRLMETLRSPLLISTREQHKPVGRRILSFEVPGETSSEQLQVWREALGEAAVALDGRVESLVSQFSLSAGNIYAAVAQALQPSDLDVRARHGVPLHGRDARATPRDMAVPAVPEHGRDPDQSGQAARATADSENQLAAALWDACRIQARPRLEGLAQRIEPSAAWDDLVLPEAQKEILRQIALHVRQRSKVYQTWGFASKGSRGLGISALFAGPSGTGKTMAGEVLANELRLDLYRIDLSQVVSKYIGETEKNLRRVFDAAEGGAAILLFDEADALFGKRTEVKDSHDRYANIEVGYLLQRMEAYRGLAILTTNRKEALDFAFLRRIRFVIEFPFPEAAQRMEIWRRIFPRQTPTKGLRVDRLARLNAAGGSIYNIAMGAAFLAADAGEPVGMAHLLSAARREFTKLERPLTDAETAGWV